jgi:thymidylate synthase
MKATTANEVWYTRLALLTNAPEVVTRGMKVKEHIGARVSVDMNTPFVVHPKRKLSDKFRFGEAAWILSGDNRVCNIEDYAPSIRKFSDNGYVFQGAYGPKVTEQLHYVCETLKADVYSRQAVISIWRENPRPSKDIPCTLSLQFLIRDEELHCIATMRSSDVWLGLPYDIFNFSCISKWIQLCLCNELSITNELSINKLLLRSGLTLGRLEINIGSSHLYERNWEVARSVISSGPTTADVVYDINEPITPNQLINWLKWNRDNA